jgi:ketosteroid isomerase-like protein
MRFKEKHLYLILLLLLNAAASAQPRNTLVNTLVAAENFFAANAKEKGIRQAFLDALDVNSALFSQGVPVNGMDYYRKAPESTASLYWEPVYARVAKSGDWGFTSGPSVYKESDTSAASYGDYLSIWKRNRRGVWKLAFDIGVDHPKPNTRPTLNYINPPTQTYFRQLGDRRIEQREDIILSTDRLYATILKADNKIAHNEFINENCILLFPGSFPISGKGPINTFWEKQDLELTSEPLKGDRAYSGELAFTYGNASIVSGGKPKKYNYLRIWELQPEFKWNVIAEVYAEAPN